MRQPIVGDPPEYTVGENEVPWVLGTQLTRRSGPLARAPEGSRVLMIEARDFAARKPYHHHKLTLLFGAMRSFRDRLRAEGYDVVYITAESFGEGLATFFSDNPDARLVAMRSPSYGVERRLLELVADAGGALEMVDSELFASTRQAFDEWANADPDGDTGTFRHEQFYRWMRTRSGVLVTDGEPVGGEWNYDDRNREVPPDDWEPPPLPSYEYDPVLTETAEWVAETFDAWGRSDMATFRWPVTRQQARHHLEQFITERLPEFGPYQDAMRSGEWAMAHALLGSSLNLGLLHPVEVLEAAEAAFQKRDLALASVEGFVRQVLGWREFMRHVYRHAMPALASANQLGARQDLPGLYWTGDTDMNCLAESVGDVYDRGYSHHIQRLMVLANFATLWGVEPAELNDWFHATYVDAYHWVTTPNVVEMGQYGQGVFATKPYVSSANYVDKMSDYCGDCQYDSDATTGDGACPFNALYWDFLDRNEDTLRSNHRMGLMYSHVDDKREAGDLSAIRERVTDLRAMAADDNL